MFSPSLCLHDRRNLCSSNLVTLLFLRKFSSFSPGLFSLLVWLIKTSLILKLKLFTLSFSLQYSPYSLNSGHWWWHCTGHLAPGLSAPCCVSPHSALTRHCLVPVPTRPLIGQQPPTRPLIGGGSGDTCVFTVTPPPGPGPHSALSPLSVATDCAAASRRPLRSPEGETQICAERKTIMFKAVMVVSSDKNRIPMPYVWESWGIV